MGQQFGVLASAAADTYVRMEEPDGAANRLLTSPAMEGEVPLFCGFAMF